MSHPPSVSRLIQNFAASLMFLRSFLTFKNNALKVLKTDSTIWSVESTTWRLGTQFSRDANLGSLTILINALSEEL